jgi:pimeloyl-ACP methyl ester carboxylesterase
MPDMKKTTFFLAAAAAILCMAGGPTAQAAEKRHGLLPCRVSGLEHDALCGVIGRPFDPARPQGLQIDVHFVVVPALARNRKRDPIIFFAGGPGQSAIELAGPVSRLLSRLGYRRDIVFIDQRGTGKSAPLRCSDDLPGRALADTIGTEATLARLINCRTQLQKLPYGDLRHFSTPLAVQDAEAVRLVLEADEVNLIGGSYGTRVVLEYMRQNPGVVRRAVIDGVAPPDMALPSSFSTDNQAALDAQLVACEGDPRCRVRFPTLRADWQALLASLPRAVAVTHPVTGAQERVTFSRDTVLGLARAPLYVPTLASALPLAISEASRGRFEALLGLSSVSVGNRIGSIAEGMHFSVVCTEDLPRLELSKDTPGNDYGDSFARLYTQVCADWPRGVLPKGYYDLAPAASATLLLSGGVDPVTPPRHAERVARLLGSRAHHVVVPQAGHGVMAMPCMRDVMFKFIDAANDAEAAKVDTACANAIPRPSAFIPVAELSK